MSKKKDKDIKIVNDVQPPKGMVHVTQRKDRFAGFFFFVIVVIMALYLALMYLNAIQDASGWSMLPVTGILIVIIGILQVIFMKPKREKENYLYWLSDEENEREYYAEHPELGEAPATDGEDHFSVPDFYMPAEALASAPAVVEETKEDEFDAGEEMAIETFTQPEERKINVDPNLYKIVTNFSEYASYIDAVFAFRGHDVAVGKELAATLASSYRSMVGITIEEDSYRLIAEILGHPAFVLQYSAESNICSENLVEAMKYASANSDTPVIIFVRDAISKGLLDYMAPVMKHLISPTEKNIISVDGHNYYIPANVYFLSSIKRGQALLSVDSFLLRNSAVLNIRPSKPAPITFKDIKPVYFPLSEMKIYMRHHIAEAYLDDESWLKIDKLDAAFVESKRFHLINRDNARIESYAAVCLFVKNDNNEAMDEALSNLVLPPFFSASRDELFEGVDLEARVKIEEASDAKIKEISEELNDSEITPLCKGFIANRVGEVSFDDIAAPEEASTEEAMAEEAPASEESPVAEEAPASEENPAFEEETPTDDAAEPAAEETQASEDAPVFEDDVPATETPAEEAPASEEM